MQADTPKLIVLRGNSGSGKSTVGKLLQERATTKTALIAQDNLRRIILKEKEAPGGDNIDLIHLTVKFALEHGYNVILEGILDFSRYGEMLRDLESSCPNNFFYYFDVSLEETLNRHATKPNADEFGEKELTAWYKPLQLTGFKTEKVISQDSSLESTVQMILSDSKLGTELGLQAS